MIYNTLGKTGIRVSAIGLGCEGFEGKDAARSAEMLDCAMREGVNFFDVYTSNPEVRRNLGAALSKYPRDGFVLQGHICSAWKNGQYLRTRESEEVRQAFDALLSMMRVDFVDVGMIHYCDSLRDYDEIMNGDVMKYALELRDAGKIGCIGISTHNTDVAMSAALSGLVGVIMFSVNPAYDMLPASEDVNVLFEKDAFDRVYSGIDEKRELLYNTCQSRGVALTVMKAYAGGLLLDEKQTPFGRAMTAAQCIHYCLTRPSVASVMAGAASEEEIRAAAAYCEASDAEKDYSDILANAPRRSFDGHCMYCGHCAPCTVGIDVASVSKYFDLSVAQGFIPETVREHYALLPHRAGECVACGACVGNCPFGVDVISKMKAAAKLFGS